MENDQNQEIASTNLDEEFETSSFNVNQGDQNSSESSEGSEISQKKDEKKNPPKKHSKKGAGKKIARNNEIMNKIIMDWCADELKDTGKLPTRSEIMAKGQEFPNNGFKASKGWCDKIVKRIEFVFQTSVPRDRKWVARIGDR